MPDKNCDGPTTGEGVGTSASEEHEYVAVRGVKTHVESLGHGNIRDVYYAIVFDFNGVGSVRVTKTVPEEVNAVDDV